MKSKFILAAASFAILNNDVAAIKLKNDSKDKAKNIPNRDREDGADEYDRLEEANDNSLEYNDIL